MSLADEEADPPSRSPRGGGAGRPVILAYSATEWVDSVLSKAGLLGYYLREHKYPIEPLILGLILGGRMEQAYRQALIISQGSNMIFLDHPISLALLIGAALFLLLPYPLPLLFPKPSGHLRPLGFLSQVFLGIADTNSRGRQMESSLKRISLMIILYLSWLMIASSLK